MFRKYIGMAEEIYGPSVPHLQGKTVRYNIQHVKPIIVPNFPKGILDNTGNSPYDMTSCALTALAS